MKFINSQTEHHRPYNPTMQLICFGVRLSFLSMISKPLEAS